MPRQFSDYLDWIGVVHKHEPAYDGIERLAELHVSWITHHKVDVLDLFGCGTLIRPCDRLFGPVDPTLASRSCIGVEGDMIKPLRPAIRRSHWIRIRCRLSSGWECH